MPADRFTSTAHLWSARPSDPNDTFLAQVVATGPPREGDARGVGLFGIPYDGAVLGRPGARFGPDAIREQMARLKPWTPARGDAFPQVRDWGNVRLPSGDVKAAHEAMEAAALDVLEAGDLPVALGGDHSLTFPVVKAHEGRRTRLGVTAGRKAEDQAETRITRLGVINLDAHLDVRDVVGQPNSGTSFGRLLDVGLVAGANLVEVGVRDFANSARYADKARKEGVSVFSADEWVEEPTVVVDHAIDIATRGTDGVYLSVDLDVLDQAHAPGVSAPTPGGVDARTLFAAIRRVAERAPLVGADFVEVAPPLDRDGMTSRAAAFAVMHLLAGLGARG